MSIAAEQTSSEKVEKPQIHLGFLDGLRGLAALFVVLCHAQLEMTWREDGGGLSPKIQHLLKPLSFGHYAVAVFIVLSGFCLMLPVARSKNGRLRGGAINYFKRRARRILPPYYAALLITLSIIAFVPGMNQVNGSHFDTCLPALRFDVILAHLLMIHNLSQNWFLKIDAPMWSVAPECQIYFLLPFVFLPLWRRFGIMSIVFAGMALGIAPHYLLPARNNFDWSCPWYIGLFGFGVAGAILCFSSEDRFVRLRQKPWGIYTSLLAITSLATALLPARHKPELLWLDILMGLTAICLIIYCLQFKYSERVTKFSIVHFLQSWFCVTLGKFSYSLYLVHFPLLALVRLYVQHLHLSANLQLSGLLFVGVPLSALTAYLFHLAFERPFMVDRVPNPPVSQAVSVGVP